MVLNSRGAINGVIRLAPRKKEKMNLYGRLLKEKKRLGKKVLRFPRTKQELLDRKRWERIMNILFRRYEFGMEDALDDMRRQDHFGEVNQLRR